MMRGKVVASIEARMGSKRLPGKMMLDICGLPLIARVIRRLQLCKRVDQIVLATTIESSDDCLIGIAQVEGVEIFRGSNEDVLGRVCAAHKKLGSDIIVEVTGDCPLVDPYLIDMGIGIYEENSYDIVSNTWVPGYPQGMDVQIFSARALYEVGEKISDSAVREHVSLYFYENPSLYKIHHMKPSPQWNYPNIRTQVDYSEDYEFVRKIYESLYLKYGDAFGINQIIKLLVQNAQWLDINSKCEEKPVR